ncbi:unnamed protein product [Gordionus sp. m RMFG-2023]
MQEKTLKIKGQFDKSISIVELPVYIKTQTQSILYQYYALPEEQMHLCSFGENESIQHLNRYMNILPYDLTIVPIPPHPNNLQGYINASFISIKTHLRKFIACQAPMSSTLADFWLMIWHHRCPKIIMLTNCMESGIDKCTKYWPNTNMSYGDIAIQTTAIKITQDYNIMDLKLKYHSLERNVRHFHFKAWPDHGVPSNHSSLITFMTLIENYETDNFFPMVVHCSAGVGRTGTFIAISILKETGLSTGVINVYKCIKSLRFFRISMVQNFDQYMFIYRVITDILCDADYRTPPFKFMAFYDNKLVTVSRFGISPLKLFANEKYEVKDLDGPSNVGRRYTKSFEEADLNMMTPSDFDEGEPFFTLPFELCGSIVMVHQDVTAKLLKKKCEETKYKKSADLCRVIQAHYPITDEELFFNIGDIILRDNNYGYWSTGTIFSNNKEMHGYYPFHKVIKSDSEKSIYDEIKSVEFVCNYMKSMTVQYHRGIDVALKAINQICLQMLNSNTENKLQLACLEIRIVKGEEHISLKHHNVNSKRSKRIMDYELRDISFCCMHPLISRLFSIITKENSSYSCHLFVTDSPSKPIIDLIGQIFQSYSIS